jgi:hypothetical protein
MYISNLLNNFYQSAFRLLHAAYHFRLLQIAGCSNPFCNRDDLTAYSAASSTLPLMTRTTGLLVALVYTVTDFEKEPVILVL